MTKPAAPKPERSRASSRTLGITIAFAVLAVGGYGAKLWQEAAAATAHRTQVLGDIAAAVQRQPIDPGELSRCAADLQHLPEHESDAELLMAQASIELARDRSERADALFGTIGALPGAPPAHQRLAARILLRRQEDDLGARATPVLRQVIELSQTAYADGRDASDLLRAWQAALRLSDETLAASLAQQLASEHPTSSATRFVQFAATFEPKDGTAAVAAAVEGLSPEPVEAMAMRVMATLLLGDLQAAVTVAQAALARAPGVFTVRWAAMGVFHACAMGSAKESVERASWLTRRDAQIEWLLLQPGVPEARRGQCLSLRDQR